MDGIKGSRGSLQAGRELPSKAFPDTVRGCAFYTQGFINYRILSLFFSVSILFGAKTKKWSLQEAVAERWNQANAKKEAHF